MASSLIRTRDAVRRAYAALPRREHVRQLHYMVDVDPQGQESLVVYVTIATDASLDATAKRAIEAELRRSVKAVHDYDIFFRWRTEDEAANEARVGTKSGLVEQLLPVPLPGVDAA